MFVRRVVCRRRWLLLQSRREEVVVRELMECWWLTWIGVGYWYRLRLFLAVVEKGLGGHRRY